MSEYEFWIYKDQTSFAFTPSFLPFSITMSAIAKSNSPVAPVTTEPKDWMKAPMPELQSGSEGVSSTQASEGGGETAQGRGGEASTQRGGGKGSRGGGAH